MNRNMTHSLFAAVFLALLGVLAACHPASSAPAATQPARPWTDLSAEAAEPIWKDEQTIILDVRTPGEFRAGRLPRAVNIDVNSSDFEKQLEKLDKDKPILVYCATGNRSVRASHKLAEKGFKQLYHVEKGFRGWTQAGKPVEK